MTRPHSWAQIRCLTISEMLAEIQAIQNDRTLTYYCETPEKVLFSATLPEQFDEAGRVFDKQVEYRWNGTQAVCIAASSQKTDLWFDKPKPAFLWGKEDQRVKVQTLQLPASLEVQNVLKNHVIVFTRFVRVKW